MKVLEALGGIGGLILLLTAIIVIGRGIFRQVSVTEDNTEALTEVRDEIRKLRSDYYDHGERLAVLEDRVIR
jgi:hypothetical protein